MARWYGQIGFVVTEEVSPGVWEPVEIPRNYYGDFIENGRRWNQNQDSVNSDLLMNNQLSIVADTFATEHLAFIRWAEVNGIKWTVTSATIAYPRITLSFGGVYAQTTAESS